MAEREFFVDAGFARLKDETETDLMRWKQFRQRRKAIHLPVGMTLAEFNYIYHRRFTDCYFTEYIPALAQVKQFGTNEPNTPSILTGGIIVVVQWEGWPIVAEGQLSPNIFVVKENRFDDATRDKAGDETADEFLLRVYGSVTVGGSVTVNGRQAAGGEKTAGGSVTLGGEKANDGKDAPDSKETNNKETMP